MEELTPSPKVTAMSGAIEELPCIAQNLSLSLQHVGLWTTAAGTFFGFCSLIAAWTAAVRAKGARKAANEAADAAVRLGRVAQLGDLIADMHELQAMLARADFPGIATKANLLRGRIVRFKNEAYNELRDTEMENLDLAREQMTGIAKVSAGKAADENKARGIQIAFGEAYEAMNTVVAVHGQHTQGDLK